MSGIDRKQILRIDCTECKGNCYITKEGVQESCEKCGGSGMLEKEVDYKFDTQGRFTQDELAEAFGIEPDEVHDAGHSSGD